MTLIMLNLTLTDPQDA